MWNHEAMRKALMHGRGNFVWGVLLHVRRASSTISVARISQGWRLLMGRELRAGLLIQSREKGMRDRSVFATKMHNSDCFGAWHGLPE
jgi:hypothetical protein